MGLPVLYTVGGTCPPLRPDAPKVPGHWASCIKLFVNNLPSSQAYTLGKSRLACPNFHCPDLGWLRKGIPCAKPGLLLRSIVSLLAYPPPHTDQPPLFLYYGEGEGRAIPHLCIGSGKETIFCLTLYDDIIQSLHGGSNHI